MSDILEGLNPAQREAASHVDGAMLILAGAGSGKTKTITARLAYLLSNGVPAENTLTLTFTNKAAAEMRSRALNLISGLNLSSVPLLCTFHKFGLLFLKFHISELGRSANFQVIDTDDKKKIIKGFEINLPTSLLAAKISTYKNSLIGPKDIDELLKGEDDELSRMYSGFYAHCADAYKRYEAYLATNNLVDFDDLLILPYKILSANERLCDEISRRYAYITVDEYQDTNDIQFKLLQKLCTVHENLAVVGDDDQSIYGWRGARIENILNFKDQFSNVKFIKLEQNYRSTDEILNAANELISHNKNRLGKSLTSMNGGGEKIEILRSDEESIEAAKIAEAIKKLLSSGVASSEIAVLYRVNALSRALEEGLNRAKIPYKMVGGVKFYERAEIKDTIAYLRLANDEHDDFSMRRIINVPKRGIGKVSLAKLEELSRLRLISLFDAFSEPDAGLSAKAAQALAELKSGIASISALADTIKKIEALEPAFGLKAYYASLLDGADRVANIDEFLAMLKDEASNKPDFDLAEFLNELSLLSDQDAIMGDAINIMSVHASKGLEFSHLFVIGLEEGFFPLLGDSNDIEEERRLAYVAITRAKRTLTLSFAASRFYRGKRERLDASRFIAEAGLVAKEPPREQSSSFSKGELIKHKLFGIGQITAVNGDRLTINFGGISRVIMSNFVEKIGSYE